MKKKTAKDIREMKGSGKRITCLTAYDFPTAELLDEAGIDIVLVGDSLGTVLLGYESTCAVTMREMLHHTKAVSRAVKHSLVVADMPFGSYESSADKALRSARRFIQEAGAAAVKLEGGTRMAGIVAELVRSGISVMGHIGLTPQSAPSLGGYKVQGKTSEEAEKIAADARTLDEAGVFALVLECIPSALAERITSEVRVPTIGIGAGPTCDGQVLVINDMLGLYDGPRPKFVRRYADLRPVIRQAIRRFQDDVLEGRYPTLDESYGNLVRPKTFSG